MAKTVWAASAALYVGVVVWAAFVLPPDGVASQVDLDGTVTSHGSRAGFLGANAPLTILMLVVAPLITRAATRPPATFLNIPNKDYWLSPERAEATFATVSREMWLLLAATNLLVAAAMFDLAWLTVHGHEAIGSAPFLVYLVGVLVWAVLFVLRFRRPKGA
ncbi:hypothetical protein [Mobilicoccus pelagius]|uniref:DUF1648 domain-containing protein n=1 Tax=Mobilicoccus pelagius NBRC 104925 TaxID=1089455 RepID=H5UPP0_9MICO|nr:hypothetical protein [Mobilicoccus pelagius]GAB47698.1 hypothetical protein MOPEL_027_00090 [Mobilicoccus pelagius NBRC 104925]